MKKVASLAVLALSGLVAVPAGAGAATINVNTFVDESADNTTCSLREAVEAANTNSNVHEDACTAGQSTDDTVTLQTGTYPLEGAPGEDGNASGDLDIVAGGPLVIDGTVDGTETPTTTIDGGGVDRIFDVRTDPNEVDLFAQHLELRNGAVTGGAEGGAIRVADPDAHFGLSTSRVQQNDAGGNGGAISFDDAVTGSAFDISQVQFAQNNADEEGGAIYIDTPQDGSATVEFSSFIENTAGIMGGAAYVESAGATNDEPVLQFVNSTLTLNSAAEGGGAVAFDFGLAGTVFFKFSTVAYNSASALGGGGGIFTNDADQLVLFQGGTIIAGNAAGGVASNCAGPGEFQTSGLNLESANTCHLSPGAPKFDLINVNPLLKMTAINPPGKTTTETMGLFSGSPAINAVARTPVDECDINGDANHTNDLDQRLVTRPAGPAGFCDIGAFEGSVGAPSDSESDGFNDPVDNCPEDPNANQANNDADFQGDVCDPDDDNDAVLDAADNCPVQAGVPSNAGCPAPPVTGTAPPPANPSVAPQKCKKKKKKKHSVAQTAKKKKCKKKKRK